LRVKGDLLSADTTADTRAIGLRFRLVKQHEGACNCCLKCDTWSSLVSLLIF